MQRNQNPGQTPRSKAERDASQSLGGQPRTDEEDEDLQDPNQVPSFLTAQELQAKDPAKGAAPIDLGNDDNDDEDDEKPAKKKGGK